MHTCSRWIILILLASSSSALAQQSQDVSPYAGEEQRVIKSLSADEVTALLNGSGMGFAKLAELNAYPGPKHVLEIAGQLQLSTQQLERTEAVYAAMKQEAVSYGRALVEAEAELDAAFAAGEINRERLASALLRIGEIEARLRNVHLAAHLQQAEILTRQQIHRYSRIRGYSSGSHDRHDGGAGE